MTAIADTPIERLQSALPHTDWITDASRVGRLSQDFAWYSPVLKRQLADKRADLAVRPKTEHEIRAIVAACATQGVPITLRGSGTGNYGQCIPLQGGLVLDLSAYNAFGWVKEGVGRAQAGIRLAAFDDAARPHGWELRWLPSTYRSATLGGLYGGGFGGAGSITYGPIAAAGNVLGVRVMTVEPEPRILELRGPEALLLHHTYGTNGIVLELEVALAPATPWTECIAIFEPGDEGYTAALDCAGTLAKTPGIVKKEVCFLGAPVPDYLTSLADWLPAGCHALLLSIAPSSETSVQDMVAACGGRIVYRKDAAEVQAGKKTLLEYTWNHTTLHAMKVDPTLTYLQTGFDPARYRDQVLELEKALGGEVLMHLEFLRTKDGACTCSGLQLVRFSTEARLDEIMQIHRDHGVSINNPHAFVVEDGKQGRIHPSVVEMKARLDPQGLLNPGKLRAWDQREQAATGLSGAVVR